MKVSLYRKELESLNIRLEHLSPIYQIRQKRQQLIDSEQTLLQLINRKVTARRHMLEIYIEKLEGLSPLKKLNKGYSLVVNKDNRIVNSIKKTTAGDVLRISVTDGDIIAEVSELKEVMRPGN